METSNQKTIEQWLEETAKQFAVISESSLLDARVLLSHSLEKPLSYLLAWPDNILSTEDILRSQRFIQRRLTGEPVSYIIESREFWSLNFKVSPDVLIPRPETEHLVEWALKHIPIHSRSTDPREIDVIETGVSDINLLDLGTGSGAIAVAIATERPEINILATDFSRSALIIAEENAQINKCKNIQFLQSDWFSNVGKKQFNLILSNPPYVAKNDPHLKQDGLPFEPIAALVADDHGFSDIKRIIHEAKTYLLPKGLLAIEHGYQQGAVVREIMFSEGYVDATTIEDLSAVDRITTCRWESVNE